MAVEVDSQTRFTKINTTTPGVRIRIHISIFMTMLQAQLTRKTVLVDVTTCTLSSVMVMVDDAAKGVPALASLADHLSPI